MVRPLIGSAVQLLAILLLLPSIALGSATSNSPPPGEQAPTFLYTDMLAGGTSSFETFERNRPVLLVFLQTACGSCHREMLAVKRLKAELEGFGVMAAFIDMTVRNVRKYIEENALPFTCTWDSSGDIAAAYGVSFSPTSFLLDAERKVVKVYRGFHPGVERAMKSDLEGLLAR